MADADEICGGKDAPAWVVVTSVHGKRDGDHFILDRKALEGFEYRAEHWPGRVIWMLSMVDTAPSYSQRYDPATLPFEIVEVAIDRSDVAAKVPAYAIVEAGADNHHAFGLVEQLPGRLIYILEYTFRTRLDILRVSAAPFYKKARSLLWEWGVERRRKRAIQASAGLLCNGLPAYRNYAALAPRATYYIDTRMTQAMLIDDGALQAKQAKIMRGEPLRLAFSGRLERMKGAHFLLPLMRALDRAGVNFLFEIFGAGAEFGAFEAAAAGDLAGKLKVHGPIPFADALVPAMKERIDLFICPHPQGDPSCTYLETLSCGVPIVGFANEAWALMAEGQRFGEVVPVGDVAGLAAAIQRLDRDRARLVDMAGEAAQFARARPFEKAFADRLAFMSDVADLLSVPQKVPMVSV